MREFLGFVVEEIYRSGDSSIPASALVGEPYPCESCVCKSACAECELSCSAFQTYCSANKKESSRWVEKMRIPTRAEFIEVLTPKRVGSV